MAMKTRKTYVIIELNTYKILHSTTDRRESMKRFDELQKTKQKVIAQTMYQ